MEKKYEILENDTIQVNVHKLHRIRALRNFWPVEKGQLGGYVESEENLSHNGDAWVFGNAKVFDHARVSDNAQVSGNAYVFGYAWVRGNAKVFDNAKVFGEASVYGNAYVFGDAWVFGNAKVCDHATVFGKAEVYGDAFIFGDSHVFGNAHVFGDAMLYGKIMLRGQARVGHTKDFQAFGGLGREFFKLTAYRTIGGIELSTNEFQGSIEEFRKWSKETYENYPKLKRSFELILEEIKVWFELND